MRSSSAVVLGAIASAASCSAQASLASVCTTSKVAAALPLNVSAAIEFDTSSVTASPVYNYTVTGSGMQPDAKFDFCNVTFSYSHAGRSDEVVLTYW